MYDDEKNTGPCEETSAEHSPVEKASQEMDVISLIDDVERHLSTIRTAQSKQVEEFASLASRMQDVEQGEQELSQHLQEMDAERIRMEEERRSIEIARSESEEAQTALDRSQQELNTQSEQIEADRDSLRVSHEELTKREEEINVQVQELEAQTEKSKQRMNELESEHEQIMSEKANAEAALRENASKLEEAEQNLAEAVERASTFESHCQELDERCESLSKETEVSRSKLRLAGERLVELAEVVSQQAPQLEQGAAAMAAMQEQARTIAELEQQLSEAPESNEESQELREKFEKAQKRADELEEALVIAQDRGQAQEFAKQLRSKAEGLSEFAQHLKRRKNRLKVLREGMRDDSQPREHHSTFRDLQRLKTQQEDLKQARQCLAVSETAMLSKWARPRAFATVVWLTAMFFCVAGGAWLVVENMMASPGTASVDLVASTRSGRPLENKALTEWMQWHEALRSDPAFVNVVASRLNARGLAPAGGEEGVAQMLLNDLSYDSDGPGRLRLVLKGDDRRILQSRLDVIATTMASESARQAPRREQSARAMIVGESTSTGQVHYASLTPREFNSEFMTRFGIVAGVGVAVALFLAFVVYAVLRRAKRIFEESEIGIEPELA